MEKHPEPTKQYVDVAWIKKEPMEQVAKKTGVKRKVIVISSTDSEPDVQKKIIKVEIHPEPRKQYVPLMQKKTTVLVYTDSEPDNRDSEPDYNIRNKMIKVESNPEPEKKYFCEPCIIDSDSNVQKKLTPQKPLNIKKEIIVDSEPDSDDDSSHKVYFSDNIEYDTYESEEDSKNQSDDERYEQSLRKYKERSQSADYRSNTVMKFFIKWMEDFPNLKECKTSRQHASQAFNYWKFATPNLTIQGFFEVTCLNRWMSDNLKDKSAGTLRSYLSSLRYFVDYVISNNMIKEEAINRALRFKEQINIISKSLAKRVKIRRTVVETEEMREYIFFSVRKYLNIIYI